MKYEELINYIEEYKLETEMQCVYFLIGYKSIVDKEDLNSIKKAVADNFLTR